MRRDEPSRDDSEEEIPLIFGVDMVVSSDDAPGSEECWTDQNGGRDGLSWVAMSIKDSRRRAEISNKHRLIYACNGLE